MEYSVSHLAAITNGLFYGNGDRVFHEISTDSRKPVIPERVIFIAIKGRQHNGHDHLQTMLEKGVKIFLVEQLPKESETNNASWVVVKDTLKALQVLAATHRKTFNFPVIGITGSNGKTIVKEWLYQVVYRNFNVVRSPHSFNSQIGVPLSVLKMERHHTLGIFEAGISQTGEMEKLEKIIHPDIGIFTNIGDAHATGFSSLKEKISEKLNLFINSEALVYHNTDTLLSSEIEEFCQLHSVRSISWGTNESANIRVKIAKLNGYSEIEANSFRFTLPFDDDASIENAIHVWALASQLNIPADSIAETFERLLPVEMRLNQKSGKNNTTLICDYYNSDLTSVELAMQWSMRQHARNGRTIILSDIEQSDLPDFELYTKIKEFISKYHFDRFIGVGNSISTQASVFSDINARFYKDTDSLISDFQNLHFVDETILIKGGRRFRFEKIEKQLQLQVHNTVLEVNMNSLGHNLNYFRNLLPANTGIMAMVKAFSYGSGGHEIAHFLQFYGVEYLAVAYPDEGIALRKDGIHLPIMVMNSDPDSYSSIIEYDLEPEIFSLSGLRSLLSAAESQNCNGIKVHIELNTGMNRLGFDSTDISQLVEILKASHRISIASIFSHLATSDEPENSFAVKQITLFEQMYDEITNSLNIKPLKHILNSSGIIHFGRPGFDLVRLGIGLYGIDPSFSVQRSLEPVGSLWSTISQIRVVKAGDGVSYGLNSVADHDRKIAVVAIGYADGLNRLLSNGNGYFVIHGKDAPIVGNVCMDMTMCDVSEIDCEVGDKVQIFGIRPTINELAEKLNTIPYEILTSVSQRVKRVYTET